MTEKDALALAQKIANSSSAFKKSIVAGGKYKIVVPDDVLVEKYGFTPSEVQLLHSFADGSVRSVNITERNETATASRASLFHISNYDLKTGTFAFLATAAQGGPAAVAAVWPLVTSIAGPLGTVAGIATALLGGAFFADLALKVVGAINQGKGITFYSQWGIPPLYVEIEGR
ncbi:hypothetical protein [Arcanobacterium bovis]|uniref:Uncharacterized protein n=1 Tax=Arcanobacterium bovis TaxID=2529275 RepID=A0A4Q9V0U3_9ACTO|nr:hypothetical protein [Arcanobacterium bovis]TBW22700.1 hypothetical protein EZJ44_01950 [Arcanobacterium bovis]